MMDVRQLGLETVRHPREEAALSVSLALAAVAVLSGAFITLGGALVLVLLIVVGIRIQQSSMLGSSATVGSVMFPAVNDIVSRVCRRMSARTPQVHVIQNPTLNAFALGFSEPFSVVLHSSLVDALTDDELAFVLGHEVGHILLGHTRVSTIVAPFGRTWPLWGWAFNAWSRLAEYSADRAGLAASGDLAAACTALIKISSGPQAAAHADVQGFITQARRVDQSQLARLGEWFGTHPYVVNRLRNLVSSYHELRLSAGPPQQTEKPQGTASRACPKCGTAALEGAVFCVRCGSGLPEPAPAEVRCSCGTKAAPDDLYCRDCGAALREPEQDT